MLPKSKFLAFNKFTRPNWNLIFYQKIIPFRIVISLSMHRKGRELQGRFQSLDQGVQDGKQSQAKKICIAFLH